MATCRMGVDHGERASFATVGVLILRVATNDIGLGTPCPQVARSRGITRSRRVGSSLPRFTEGGRLKPTLQIHSTSCPILEFWRSQAQPAQSSCSRQHDFSSLSFSLDRPELSSNA